MMGKFGNIDFEEAKRRWDSIRCEQKIFRDIIKKLSQEDIDNNIPDDIYLEFAATCTTPQSYGVKIQNRYKRKNSFATVDTNENSGDMVKNGTYKEFKVSILTDTNKTINIVHIRSNQKNIEYIIRVVDLREDVGFIIYDFHLTHKEMIRELDIFGWPSAHGTEKFLANNENKEYRFSFKPNSKHFTRWKEKYLK